MDALHDPTHRTWVEFASNFESVIPSYVMDYKLPDVKTASLFSTGEFADPVRRWWPINSPASTWLSTMYFLKNASILPYKPAEFQYIRQTLDAAARDYGIKDDVEKIAAMLVPPPVSKLDSDADYGLILRRDDGVVVDRKYPMFDVRGIKAACDYFAENRDKYPGWMRRTIASNIMKKAAEFGIGTDDIRAEVKREAGFGLPRRDVLMLELLERARLTKDAEAAIALANVNDLLATMSADDLAANLDKVAEIVEEFDRVSGLTQHYGIRITLPADFLYDVDIKAAAAAIEDSVELDKHVFSLNKLAELSPEIFEAVLGQDFAKAIVKNAKVDRECLADNLYSLPKPDRAALEEYLMSVFG